VQITGEAFQISYRNATKEHRLTPSNPLNYTADFYLHKKQISLLPVNFCASALAAHVHSPLLLRPGTDMY